MSAVYILAWLGFAVGVGWFVVWLDEKCHELDRTIDEVLDAPRKPAADFIHAPGVHCPPCAEKGVCLCPSCVREAYTGEAS
jgi:hypothetical protein